MKKLKLISLITLLFMFTAVVQCSKDDPAPATVLGSLTGIVNYPNSAGTATPASGATVTLLSAGQVLAGLTDDTGKFNFPNLAAGTYSLSASFYALPTNTGGRMEGLNFATAADVSVTMAAAALTQNLDLVSTGQTGSTVEAIDINYAWTGSSYANTGTWAYDGTHSPVAFEFAYRGAEADFVGSFAQLSKLVLSVDPANPATGTIDAEVDMLSVNTRAAGGRDPIIQNGANEVGTPNNYTFSPTTIVSVMGCITGTFGIVPDATVPSVIVNDNGDRYAKFQVNTGGIAKYGDGYIAKGTLTWRGFSVLTEMWFKLVPKWLDAPAPGVPGSPNGKTYSGFEGKFLIDPYGKFNIRSGSVNEAIMRIQISVVCTK